MYEYVCVYECVLRICAHECKDHQGIEKGILSLRVEVIGSCESSNIDARN